MKHLYFALFLGVAILGITSKVNAASGDTTVVTAHDEVHWDWNGDFYDTVQFPQSGNYQKIIMHYIIGCPSIGCSGWDYTTRILLHDENTPSEKYELAKVITPYAGDKNQGWFHEYKFDVTHLRPLFNGEKVINAKYHGWQDGFTITVYFEFIEGTPIRDVLQVDQVYFGGYKYGDNSNPINTQLQLDTLNKASNVDAAEMIMSSTGHGFGNNNGNGVNPENCAEFCDKWYQVKVNGAKIAEQTVWRDDCGSEPLYAQTGTWVYNRAGWCPGSESQVFRHDITAALGNGTDFKVKVDWQDYTATNVNMSYNISGQVIQYGAPNFNLDAEIYDVLNPTNYDRYSRYNPTAQAPTIVLRNNGTTVIGSMKIKYGVEGGTFYTTTWQGALGFNETYEATLPIPDYNFFKGGANQTFVAEILEVNGVQDEVSWNNKYRTSYEVPDRIDGAFRIKVKTNNVAHENWYILTNSLGDTILFEDNLSDNTDYFHELNLDKGAYTFYIEDSGGDGLSWWANPGQGSGNVEFRNIGIPGAIPPSFLDVHEADFGNFYVYDFTANYGLVDGNDDYDETTWAPPLIIGMEEIATKDVSGTIKLFPNPVQDQISIESISMEGRVRVRVTDLMGRQVYFSHRNVAVGNVQTIDASSWSPGVYVVNVDNGYETESIKFIKK